MAAIVAPDCVRYTLVGSMLGREVVNVIDMVVNGAGVGDADSRTDACETVAKRQIDWWFDNLRGLENHLYSLDEVRWVDLDSTSGSVGAVTASDDHELPDVGGVSGEALPASVATLVTKQAASQRGRRNGRMFLPNAGENQTDGNFLNATFVQNANDGLAQWLEDATQTGVGVGINTFPTVIHTKNTGTKANPVISYDGNSQIRSMICQARVATQRRRNRA